jgi:hypothetical protein
MGNKARSTYITVTADRTRCSHVHSFIPSRSFVACAACVRAIIIIIHQYIIQYITTVNSFAGQLSFGSGLASGSGSGTVGTLYLALFLWGEKKGGRAILSLSLSFFYFFIREYRDGGYCGTRTCYRTVPYVPYSTAPSCSVIFSRRTVARRV